MIKVRNSKIYKNTSKEPEIRRDKLENKKYDRKKNKQLF